MSLYLGIDTSNYTTSAALYQGETGEITSKKKLLPVPEGALGLRQSDAVFAHVRQLPGILEELFSKDVTELLTAVCVSDRPRRAEGSYMPAFLAGKLAATAIAQAQGIPCHFCSHQEGHLMAALYAVDRLELRRQPFFGFHVSGGTTECLLVEPDDRLFSVRVIGQSLDLHAGQLVDRVALRLGLPFPGGPALEQLALTCTEPVRVRVKLEGTDCHLSGVENQCERLLQEGKEPSAVARYALEYLKEALIKMAGEVTRIYGEHPFVCAGGVMSNTLIRTGFQSAFPAFFAPPVYSADNAAGVAVLASLLKEE